MQMSFACALQRARLEQSFFCLNGRLYPDGTSCFFAVRWCLTKCIGSHSSCIDETTFLLNIPVVPSSGAGEVPALQANGSPGLVGREGKASYGMLPQQAPKWFGSNWFYVI